MLYFMTLAHSYFRRQSDLLVKLNRLLERCLRNSKCIDTESLCVVAGEKVGNMPKILNLRLSIVYSWIPVSILLFSSSVNSVLYWFISLQMFLSATHRTSYHLSKTTINFGESINLDMCKNVLLKEFVVFHVLCFLRSLSKLIEAGNVFLFHEWRTEEQIISFYCIGLLTYTGVSVDRLSINCAA